jgi:hypothetical protein
MKSIITFVNFVILQCFFYSEIAAKISPPCNIVLPGCPYSLHAILGGQEVYLNL